MRGRGLLAKKVKQGRATGSRSDQRGNTRLIEHSMSLAILDVSSKLADL